MQSDTQLRIAFDGGRGRLFWLILTTMTLTILTVGIYRFWMRARTRRYYWSSIKIGGLPLEYSGTGLEKLFGFLIAVIFLAVYLGLLQIGIMFAGFSNPVWSQEQSLLVFVVVLPLIFFARYRARRYILSRTRWRGIRFNAEAAGLHYMLHGMWHSLITLLSLGLLYPRQVYMLDKFATDRSTYGDLPLSMEGRWMSLMGPWFAVWICAVPALLVLGWFSYTEQALGGAPPPDSLATAGLVALLLPVAGLLFLRWQVVSFRVLTSMKRIGDRVTLKSSARSVRYILAIVLGTLGTYVLAILVFVVLAAATMAGLLAASPELRDLAADSGALADLMTGPGQEVRLAEMGGWMAGVSFGALFVLTAAVIVAVYEVLVSRVIFAHFARTIVIFDADELDAVQQSAQDASREAGGFADALDVGAAI
ncbi:MAG: DUF898 family protein [Pseudomonadota bacterium]